MKLLSVETDCRAAPPVDDFKEVLECLRSGGASTRQSTCTGQDKLWTVTSSRRVGIRWSLKEALIDQDREFLKGASTISLQRDERAQRLLVRYTAARGLEVRQGILGMVKDFGGSAENIVAATRDVFLNFATCRAHPPAHATCTPITDHQLLNNVRHAAEVLVVDAAADELLAGEVGRGRRASVSGLEVLTPNLRFIARDKAHACRRTGLSC